MQLKRSVNQLISNPEQLEQVEARREPRGRFTLAEVPNEAGS